MATPAGAGKDLTTSQEQHRIKGTASFATSGPDFDRLKATFGWMRAVVTIDIREATQIL